MLLRDGLDLVQYLFMVFLTVLVLCGLNYEVLLGSESVSLNKNNTSGVVVKTTLSDGFYSFSETLSRISVMLGIVLFAALLFLLGRLVYTIHNATQYKDTKAFFSNALKIPDSALQNVTWDEVKKQLMEVQLQQRMCVHKDILTSLDIYQRILRHQNYMVALVNQGIIPVRFNLPFYGEMVFYTKGYEFNLQLLLFWGPLSLLQSITPESLRQPHRKKEIIASFEKKIVYLSIINFFSMFFVFVYQVLYSLYHNVERVKNEPGSLAGRCWSQYGRIYLRHYNELDHELNSRLNRAYKPSMAYLNSFSSPALSVIAGTLVFIASAIFAVIVAISLFDDDFLRVEHVINLLAVSVIVIAVCRNFIPDENLVWVPEMLMERIVTQIHYLPESWTGRFHTTQVRDEFSRLFQYKFVHLLEELISPLFVPFILFFSLRHRAKEIVDFFHMFTVSVEGIGDVCSFAQMDIKQHGSPNWQPDVRKANDGEETNPEQRLYAPDKGRTELSLMHFALTNPDWQPPKSGAAFLTAVKQRPHQECHGLTAVAETDLAHSINSLNLTGQDRIAHWMAPTVFGTRNVAGPSETGYVARGFNGGVAHVEGPMQSSVLSGAPSLQGSLHQSSLEMAASIHPALGHLDDGNNSFTQWLPQTQTVYDMGMSCLYLRGLSNRRRHQNQYYDEYGSGAYRDPRSDAGTGAGHPFQSQESSIYDPRSRMYQRTPSPPAMDPFRDAMVSHLGSSAQLPSGSISSQYQEMLHGASDMIQQQRSQTHAPQQPPPPTLEQPGSAAGMSDDTPLLRPNRR
ncbi:hypothetical protein HAZT_HAZT001368 [Hyalella azteca]|nr:hypothetical protein HAZT_HAZT001368 [Hyalella azteca]